MWQRLVGPLLDGAALVRHRDAIGLARGARAVRNDEKGAFLRDEQCQMLGVGGQAQAAIMATGASPECGRCGSMSCRTLFALLASRPSLAAQLPGPPPGIFRYH